MFRLLGWGVDDESGWPGAGGLTDQRVDAVAAFGALFAVGAAAQVVVAGGAVAFEDLASADPGTAGAGQQPDGKRDEHGVVNQRGRGGEVLVDEVGHDHDGPEEDGDQDDAMNAFLVVFGPRALPSVGHGHDDGGHGGLEGDEADDKDDQGPGDGHEGVCVRVCGRLGKTLMVGGDRAARRLCGGGLRGLGLLGLIEAVGSDFLVERCAVDPELGGGGGAVPAVGTQRIEEDLAFGLGQGVGEARAGTGLAGCCCRCLGGQVFGEEGGLLAEGQGVLEGGTELAEVAGPGAALELGQGVGRQAARGLALGELVEHGLGDRRQVIGPVTQGRQIDPQRDGVEEALGVVGWGLGGEDQA